MNLVWNNKFPGYAEEGQDNPLRWVLLSKSGGDVLEATYENTGTWWKCKDFLNDTVFAIQTGKQLSIYGWNTANLSLPKKGEPLYLAVKDFTKNFENNVNNCLGNAVTFVGDGELNGSKVKVLEIAPQGVSNTYFISLITLMIRLCNSETSFQNVEELKAYKGFGGGDQGKWDEVVAKGWLFDLPQHLTKFIWYCGDKYNSETVESPSSSMVHNCGVLSWQQGGSY